MNRPTREIAGRWQRRTWLGIACLWLGGLTFYAAIVVPLGAELTDSTTQGFVTQRVTHWLNLFALLYLATTWRDAWPRHGEPSVTPTRRLLWWSLAASLFALVLLHPQLDQLLDFPTRSVLDAERFYRWHRYYLLATTAQWIAGVGHVAAVWRSIESAAPPLQEPLDDSPSRSSRE